jgi:hypothetical protein
MGSIELLLREDILKGQEAESPLVCEWLPLTHPDKKGERGALEVEMRWHHGVIYVCMYPCT